MAILDASSLTTYTATTLTNGKAAADLVTGPINPASYTDPLLSSVGLDQVVNFNPEHAALDAVGSFPIIKNLNLNYLNNLFFPPSVTDKVVKFTQTTEFVENQMEVIGSINTPASYLNNGMINITDGNIPNIIKVKVQQHTLSAISANGGVAPESLYDEVAGMLTNYVSGMSQSALSTALRANDIMGLAPPIVPNDLSGLGLSPIEIFQNEYDDKVSELTTFFDGLIDADGIAAITTNSGVSPTTGATLAASGGGSAAVGTSGGAGSGAGGGGLLSSVEPSGGGENNNPPTVSLPLPSPEFQFKGVDGNWEFPNSGNSNQNMTAGGRFVSSVEELECEMSALTRNISEVIVHWSETFTNANLTATELEQVTGTGAAAYHYIIKRDGSMERGVSLNSAGSASPGHNSYSIQVCLVGGVNVASGDEDIYGNLGASSITRTQYNTLHELFRVFFVQYPGGQALGHGEFEIDQLDPGFEVRDYVYNSFNKTSLYVDPLSEAEKSPDEIIAAINDPELLLSEKDTEDSGLNNF